MNLQVLFVSVACSLQAWETVAFSASGIRRHVSKSKLTQLSMSDTKENGFIDELKNGFKVSDKVDSLEVLLSSIYASPKEHTPPSETEDSSLFSEETLAELQRILENARKPAGFAFEQDEYWAKVRKHVTEAMTMPPEGFRSPDFYNVEQEKVFAKTWQVVAFTDQLREVGDKVAATTAGQPIVLTRAKDGEIRAFYNVCRHRGARLVSEEDSDCKKKCISCPYHNWGYSLDGRLMGTPLWNKESQMTEEELDERLKAAFTTEDVVNFHKEDYGLLPVRVETWGPFVYVNVSGDAPPLKEYLGRVTEDLALYPFKDLVTVRKAKVDIQANWKLLAENFLDYYHVPTVHPGYCDVSRVDDHDRSQGKGMYMCHVTYPLTNAGSALDLDRFPLMPGLEGSKHEITGWFHLHFPNMFYFLLPHSLFVVIIEPTGPTTSTEHVRLLLHKDSLEQAGEGSEETIQAMWEAYSKVNQEDFAICEECQEGVNAQQFAGGRMAWTFEESINRFHKLVANCMTGNPHEIPDGDVITSKFDKIPIINETE